jgi:hypothetical protein
METYTPVTPKITAKMEKDVCILVMEIPTLETGMMINLKERELKYLLIKTGMKENSKKEIFMELELSLKLTGIGMKDNGKMVFDMVRENRHTFLKQNCIRVSLPTMKGMVGVDIHTNQAISLMDYGRMM